RARFSSYANCSNHWTRSSRPTGRAQVARQLCVFVSTTGYVGAVAGLLTEPPRDETGSRRADQSLVVVAHRGPVQFARRDGRAVVERGAGGLVTALRHVARNTESMRWICAAASDEDRAVAARERWSRVPLGDACCLMHMVDVDPNAHHAFYAVI